MMRFRLGVVGAGTHGERYVRHGRQDVPGMTVRALCRRDAAAGRALAERHGVRHHTKASALISDPEVDGVVICTPPASHFPLAQAVLAAGKPLLVEKPMTGTVAEAEQLAALDAEALLPLMVGQSLRWNPVLLQVRRLWPRLGQVRLIRLAQRLAPTKLAWQRDPAQTVGGSVLLTGVHIFDLARWLTGTEIVSVDSRQARIHNPVVEDVFQARAVLSDGCWASFEVSKYTQSRAGILEAVGDAGQLSADYQHGGVTLRCGSETETWDVSAQVPTLPAVLQSWLAAMRTGSPPPVTVHDGLATLRIVDACYRSAASGQEVHLD